MGTSPDFASLAVKLDRYAGSIAGTDRKAVQGAALDAKRVMVAGAGRAGLRPGRPLPRETRAGKAATKPWGVQFKVTGGEALVQFVGPVHWLESGTKPHLIVPRKSRQRFGRGGKNGPTKRQREQGAVLFGFLTGEGGAGMAVSGSMPIGNSPGGKDGVVRRGAFKHKGTQGKRFWQPTKQAVVTQATARVVSHHIQGLKAHFS